MSRRNLTPEQRAKSEERKAKFADIIKRVAEMPDDERAQLASKIMVTNCDGHALSPRNQLLIALQIGTHCTIVGGFRQWLKQGRCVIKGQHGATILFPRTFGDKNGPDNATAASEQAAAAENANGKKSPVRFLSGTVFDISQTQEIDGQTKGEAITDLTDAADREATDPNNDPAPPLPSWHEAGKEILAAAVALTPEPHCNQTEREHLPTIWDADKPEPGKQYLITAPTPNQRARFYEKKKARASMMNRPPPGGWTEADKVPKPINCIHCDRKAVTVEEGIAFCFLHAPAEKKPATPQVPAMAGMTPLALPPSPALQPPNDDTAKDVQWELLSQPTIPDRYALKLRSVPNPDRGQTSAQSSPETITSNSLEECQQAALAYISRWNLGSSNWPLIYIWQGKTKIARVSYNGRLWTPQSPERYQGEEITLPWGGAI